MDTLVGVTDLTKLSFGPAGTVTTALDGFELVGVVVPGAVPDAIAVFVTLPVLTSAWVTTYVAVHVVDAAGARVVVGQVIGESVPVPENAVSATLMLLIVTLPVFVTTNEYVTVSPAAETVLGVTDFTNDSEGEAGTVTTALDGFESVGVVVPGGVPEATAVFVTLPLFTSACVMT